MIYFDNSATTKPYPEALATYTEVATRIWGNPSSLHNLGSQATRILEASRKQKLARKLRKFTSRLVGQKGTTGSSRVSPLRKLLMASISLSLISSILPSRNRLLG